MMTDAASRPPDSAPLGVMLWRGCAARRGHLYFAPLFNRIRKRAAVDGSRIADHVPPVKLLPVLSAVLVCCGAVSLRAAAIALDASRDNTIYSEFTGNSNGQGPFVYAGRNANDNLRRALFSFDLNAIPSAVTITAVQLILSMDRTISGASNFSLHRVGENWGEGASNAGTPGGTGNLAQPGDATWTAALFPGTLWSTPGGKFAASASATTAVDNVGTYTWTSAQMAADVQGWVSNPATNFGWLLKDGETALSAKRFISGEGAAALRPKLVVTYEPVIAPEPSSSMLLAAGAALFGIRRSKRCAYTR